VVVVVASAKKSQDLVVSCASVAQSGKFKMYIRQIQTSCASYIVPPGTLGYSPESTAKSILTHPAIERPKQVTSSSSKFIRGIDPCASHSIG